MTTAGLPRLTVDDWVQAGFAILAEDGIKALTISRLCGRLRVTKGSFYWHFKDMSAYRAELISAFAAVRAQDRECFDGAASQPPRQRLSEMMAALVTPRHWMLERAMREWARSEEAAAAAVRTSDRTVLAAVRQVFVDAGFAPDDADVRAGAAFAAGIGFLHLSGPQPDPHAADRRERFIDLLLQR